MRLNVGAVNEALLSSSENIFSTDGRKVLQYLLSSDVRHDKREINLFKVPFQWHWLTSKLFPIDGEGGAALEVLEGPELEEMTTAFAGTGIGAIGQLTLEGDVSEERTRVGAIGQLTLDGGVATGSTKRRCYWLAGLRGAWLGGVQE